VSSFDVRVFAIRRRPGRTAFEVRWRVAGCDRSRSFMTRALADSYRAELIRAARKGAGFDPATGEPAAWAAPEPTTVTWYQHAVAYAQMKWPRLAPHSRASLADALATVTPLLTTGETRRRPSAGMLRAALYGYAFSPQRHSRTPDPVIAGTLAWLERASLPVSQLQRPSGHPGCPGRAMHAPRRLARRGEHRHPQAGGVPRCPQPRRRAWAAGR
jgi:hypothetical protein